MNPWTELPDEPPFVLTQDRPYVDAWNAVRGANERVRVILDAMPEPFAGPRDARLVVLGRNPGWSGSSADDHASPRLRAALRANLRPNPTGHVQAYLTEDLAFTSGAGYWRRCLREVVRESGLSYADLAHRVLAIEFHGYHSIQWSTFPITLPSQAYGYHLVRDAISRGAVIVVTRGWADWAVAVPELREYGGRVVTKNPQSASISRKNLRNASDIDAVVEAVV